MKAAGSKPKAPSKTKRAPKAASEIVASAIQRIGKQLEDKELKGSVGDFVRLLDVQRELLEKDSKGKVHEIKITWIEPTKEPATEE